MRRAAVSIPSNIAEGVARQTKREFVKFLYIARGSLSELDTQAELAGRLNYFDESVLLKLEHYMVRIDKMLSRLISRENVRRET